MKIVPAESKLDLKTFNHLFSEYHSRLIRFAITYLNDEHAAEDIVMESFMASWDKKEILTAKTFPAYTFMIVKNKCLNQLRTQQFRNKVSEDIYLHQARMQEVRIATLKSCDPEELFKEEVQRLVQETMDKQSVRTREIFMRSRFKGESYKEIAQEMNITEKSVEFEISKAIKILRVSLKDYLPGFIIMLIINRM